MDRGRRDDATGLWNHRRMRVTHAGNSDDPVKMAQKYRFLDTMLTRMGELRDEAFARRPAGRAVRRLQHRAHAARHQERQGQHQACWVPARRTRLHRPLAGEYEFVDVIRSLAGDIQGPYTWWSQRGRAFDNNVGWRIDYQFAT